MDTEPCTDLEQVPSSDGKSSNDRFRCLVCVEYGSDDESKSFTQNNKSVHLRTTKHRLALNRRTLKLGEKPSAQPQCEQPPSQPISALLPLPEIPPVLPDSQDNMNSDVFRNFRRLGLTYLDENGEQLEFSAGTVPNGGEGNSNPNEETGAAASEYSDSESDDVDPQSEWPTRNIEQTDYWPYPSKTVSRIHKHLECTYWPPRCFCWMSLTTCHICGSRTTR